MNARRSRTVSNIVTIKTEVRDPVAISSTCRRLDLAEPIHGAVRLYGGKATGRAHGGSGARVHHRMGTVGPGKRLGVQRSTDRAFR